MALTVPSVLDLADAFDPVDLGMAFVLVGAYFLALVA